MGHIEVEHLDVETIKSTYPSLDRKDLDTEAKVNLGIFIQKFSGNTTKAAEYMEQNQVPETVIDRVLLQPELRREVVVIKSED